MESILEIKNLQKTFLVPGRMGAERKAVQAVDGIGLEIYRGEHLGLVGESGSGKSTLARLILKLYKPDRGKILFEGKDAVKLSQRAFRSLRKKVQMVFQDPYSSLDPRFTVRAILKEALCLVGKGVSRDQKEGKMVEALQTVGLSEGALSRFPHEFSGGERQRIAIARCLIMKPELLILDEAVSSLDVLIQAQIIDLLKMIQSKYGVTYLFITHNLRVVRKLCHRIAVMYRGKIVEMAPVEELFQNPMHPYTQRLLKAAVDYKASKENPEQVFDEKSHLIDKGNGHFVLH